MLNTPLCSGAGKYHSDGGKNPRQLNTVTLSHIYGMADAPQQTDKPDAQWVIFSDLLTRSHDQQKQNGSFYALWIDIDENAPSLTQTVFIFNQAFPETQALIYTSRGATEGNHKCRIIIPLAGRVVGADYIHLQTAINNRLELEGLTPDRSTERTGQPCFLPNKGDYYDSIKLPGQHLNAYTALADELEALRIAEQQAEAERLHQREQARLKAAQRMATDCRSPVDAFNAEFDVALMLETYGYKRIGKRYLSPNSASRSPGVVVKGNRWISSHHSDSDIGRANDSGTSGDAFDLFVYFEHGGDYAGAVKATGVMFTTANGETITQHNQRQYMQQQDAQQPDYNAPVSDSTMNAPATDANFWVYSDGTNAAQDYPEAANDTQQQSVATSQPRANLSDQKPVFSLDLDSARLTPDWLDVEPPARVMLVDGFLPAGITGILAAAGGTGKSMLALQLAAAITGGEYFYDMPITENGPVLVLSAEDEREECQRRLYSMKQNAPQHLQSWNIDWGKVTDNLLIKDLVGTPLLFTSSDAGGTARITAAVQAMAAELKEHLAGLKMIVVDTYSRFNGGKENANEDAAMFVKACEMLSKETGATVLIAAHTRKSSEGKADDIGGGARFVDSSRWAATLHRYISDDEAEQMDMEPDEAARYVRLKVVKDNYCGKQGVSIFLKREAGGTLVESGPIRSNNTDGRTAAAEEREERVYQESKAPLIGIIISHEEKGEPMTRHQFRQRYAGKDGPFNCNEKRLGAIINRAVREEVIYERPKPSGHGKTLHASEAA